MFKKFFAVMLLAVTLMLIGNNQSEAREVYVGSYSDGSSVYLLTESVQKRVWARSVGFTCTVRAGRDYLDYTFWGNDTQGYQYENSEGYEGRVYNGTSPVADEIFAYVRRNILSF